MALRVTYVGELGWELHVPVEFALTVYDALMAAGQPHGLANAGYRAIESLRLEKGYRAWGAEIGPDHSPLVAGLGWAVKLKRDTPFLGREALLEQQAKPLPRLLAGFTTDPEVVLLGRETIYRDGAPRRLAEQRRLRLHGRPQHRLRLCPRPGRRRPRLRPGRRLRARGRGRARAGEGVPRSAPRPQGPAHPYLIGPMERATVFAEVWWASGGAVVIDHRVACGEVPNAKKRAGIVRRCHAPPTDGLDRERLGQQSAGDRLWSCAGAGRDLHLAGGGIVQLGSRRLSGYLRAGDGSAGAASPRGHLSWRVLQRLRGERRRIRPHYAAHVRSQQQDSEHRRDQTVGWGPQSGPAHPAGQAVLDQRRRLASACAGAAVPTSIVAHNGTLAVVLQHGQDPTRPGKVAFYPASAGSSDLPLKALTVGPMPADATFTPDGRRLLVANEGEPTQDYRTDPLGSVSIIDLTGGVGAARAVQVDFSAWNQLKSGSGTAGCAHQRAELGHGQPARHRSGGPGFRAGGHRGPAGFQGGLGHLGGKQRGGGLEHRADQVHRHPTPRVPGSFPGVGRPRPDRQRRRARDRRLSQGRQH